MIEIEMPGDIKEYEPKIIGGLTLRQTICFGTGLLTAIVFYNIIPNSQIKLYAASISAIIPVLCAIYKPYDMPLEQFVILLLKTYILPPKNRKYIINNEYEECIEEETEEQKKERILRSRKKKKQNQKSKNEDILAFK